MSEVLKGACHRVVTGASWRQMPDNWSRQEVEAIVSDYFDMLLRELRGEAFNKAEQNRQLRKILTARSKGSIEKKHQNISAVLIERSFPSIRGYKPLGNYQELLDQIIVERLTTSVNLHLAASGAVRRVVNQVPSIRDILAIEMDPPNRTKSKFNPFKESTRIEMEAWENYFQIESSNTSMGQAGTNLILEFERQRLWKAGKKNLAEQIKPTFGSAEDPKIFNILSFETDGRKKPIRVKTTQFGALTPFFVSKNEVTASAMPDTDYHLYRLFDFIHKPKFFVLSGSIRETCSLDPVEFAALPR